MTASLIVGLTLSAPACGRTWNLLPGEESSTGELGDESSTVPENDASTDSQTSADSAGADSSDPNSSSDTADIEPDEPPPPTCREILDCLAACLANGGTLDCLSTCSEGAEPAESQAAGALMGCMMLSCVTSGACSLDQLDNPDCLTCIGFGLVVPSPAGCEEQAAACQ